jgi:hypothetical protein
MTRPFVFADDPVSHDTVKDFESLAERARSGEVTGAAYTITTKSKGYSANVTGLLHDSPAFAIGTVVILLYRLVMRAIGRDK